MIENEALLTPNSISTLLSRSKHDNRGLSMDQHIAYIEKMVEKGGPEPSEYDSFQRWLDEVADELRSGKIDQDDLEKLREAFGRALSSETLQGFSLHKPHGYTGDFEIIDHMYQEYVTDDPSLKKWDQYFHSQSAPIAVRNRKAYFKKLLKGAERKGAEKGKDPVYVLDVASGPARDIYEFLNNGREHNVLFECVDSDADAIAYAKDLCSPYLDQIEFQEVNAFRFTSEREYDLIWSAGLFDYLSDKGFTFLLQNLLPLLSENGELVIGNFAVDNPTRDYMEIIGDWYLHYRSAEELINLAKDCGVEREDVRIGVEEAGVNLFLHIKRGEHFIEMD